MAGLKLEFLEENVSAVAILLEREAPRTCRLILEQLPFEGELLHGIWSGPETYLPIDPTILAPAEHQATSLVPGDIGYFALEGGRLVDWPENFAEVLFAYGRGARPSMPTGPVTVNIFGRITGNLEEFARMCARMKREGAKRFRIERC
ncbi:MAG TPA: DUF3830 family protein [Vicinamibacteria bacterium]|nr:DUF3830 family protein [Vicinamibacteria bacterium]